MWKNELMRLPTCKLGKLLKGNAAIQIKEFTIFDAFLKY